VDFRHCDQFLPDAVLRRWIHFIAAQPARLPAGRWSLNID